MPIMVPAALVGSGCCGTYSGLSSIYIRDHASDLHGEPGLSVGSSVVSLTLSE